MGIPLTGGGRTSWSCNSHKTNHLKVDNSVVPRTLTGWPTATSIQVLSTVIIPQGSPDPIYELFLSSQPPSATNLLSASLDLKKGGGLSKEGFSQFPMLWPMSTKLGFSGTEPQLAFGTKRVRVQSPAPISAHRVQRFLFSHSQFLYYETKDLPHRTILNINEKSPIKQDRTAP